MLMAKPRHEMPEHVRRYINGMDSRRSGTGWMDHRADPPWGSALVERGFGR
jgi:hypothetical protein